MRFIAIRVCVTSSKEADLFLKMKYLKFICVYVLRVSFTWRLKVNLSNSCRSVSSIPTWLDCWPLKNILRLRVDVRYGFLRFEIFCRGSNDFSRMFQSNRKIVPDVSPKIPVGIHFARASWKTCCLFTVKTDEICDPTCFHVFCAAGVLEER